MRANVFIGLTKRLRPPKMIEFIVEEISEDLVTTDRFGVGVGKLSVVRPTGFRTEIANKNKNTK